MTASAEDSSTPPPAGVDFPQPLERVLRSLLGIAFMLVLLVPVGGAIEGMVRGGLPILDAGGGTPVTRAVLVIIILFSTVIGLLLPSSRVRHPAPTRTLAIFVAVWIAAALGSVCVSDSLQNAVLWLSSALFLWVAREVAPTRAALQMSLYVLLGIGVVLAMMGVRVFEPHEGDPAFRGAFYQADVAAGYLLLLIPLAVSMLVGARRLDEWLFYGFASLFLTACLILTYSRGGQLTILLSVFLVAVLSAALTPSPASIWARLRPFLLALGVLVIGFCIAGLLSSDGASLIPDKVMARAQTLVNGADEVLNSPNVERGTDKDSSLTARLNYYRGGWRMALARPLLGWGPSTFGRVWPRFQQDVRYYSKYTHSAYVAILAESGFVGIVAFGAFLGALLLTSARQIKAARQAGPWNVAAAIGLFCSVCGGLLHVLIDVDWEFHMVQVLFFGIAGLLLSDGVAADRLEVTPGFTSHRAMLARWALTAPIMALMVLQVFPIAAFFQDSAAAAARQSGNVDAAIEAERQAVAYMPFSAISWRLLADATLSQVEADPKKNLPLLDAAVDAASRAVALDPCRAVNHDQLARTLITKGDTAGGLLAEKQAIVCDPVNYPKFYNIQADLLIAQHQDEEAIAGLKGIAARYPTQIFAAMWPFRRETLHEQLSQTWFILGMLELKRGHAADARAAFDRAIFFDEDLVPSGTTISARFQLGNLLMNEGQPGLALEQFRRIYAIKPTHGVSKWVLGLAYRALGQYARATTLLDEAWKEYPSLRDGNQKISIPPDFFYIERRPTARIQEGPG